MEKGNFTKILLVVFLLIIVLIVGIFVLNNKNENKQQANTENSVNSTNSNSVSYVILQVEDINASELAYKDKKITDNEKINLLMKVIDSASAYQEENFDFGDAPSCATIYLSNGEKYTVAAGDEINDNGKTVNLMTKWTSEDGSGKTLYKVSSKLGETIKKLFNE